MNLIKAPDLTSLKKHTELKNACIVFESGYSSTLSFYEIFIAYRKSKKGRPTDKEQDLLRAMFVFASSTLDSTVKQLIRDSLESVTSKDVGSQKMFSEEVDKKLRKFEIPLEEEIKNASRLLNTKLIAEALTSKNSRRFLLEKTVNDLTGDSLQSIDQLLKVAAIFAISREEITKNPEELRKIFEIRTDIIHETDIDLKQIKRKRLSRKIDDMISYTNDLLNVCINFFDAIDKKLNLL